MTDVTRQQYVNLILSLRGYPAGRSPAVDATDISRAAAESVTAASPTTLPSVAQTEIDGNVDPTALPVYGSDIRNLVQSKATIWQRVRILRYELDGNQSPAGAQYTKYAYVTAPVLPSTIPGTGDSLYDALDTGEDIDLAAFNVILATLGALINGAVDAEYGTTLHYCHSQCHSNCHGSRGRR